MPVTPEEIVNIGEIEFEEQPTLTFWRNPKTNRLEGTAEGLKAMAQDIEAILNTERFQWQIYGPYTGMQWDGLIGQDPGYVVSEMQRRMKDAFSVDTRIVGIDSFSYTVQGDTLTAQVAVKTVYGTVQRTVEVKLS